VLDPGSGRQGDCILTRALDVCGPPALELRWRLSTLADMGSAPGVRFAAPVAPAPQPASGRRINIANAAFTQVVRAALCYEPQRCALMDMVRALPSVDK